MAELADALDLGSSSNGVGVQVLFPAPNKKRVEIISTLFLFLIKFLNVFKLNHD